MSTAVLTGRDVHAIPVKTVGVVVLLTHSALPQAKAASFPQILHF